MKKSKGIFSFDTSIAMLVITIMMSQFIIISNEIANGIEKQREKQEFFDALFSISEILVSYDLAEKEYSLGFGSKRVRGNVIDDEELQNIDIKRLEQRFGISKLSIGFTEGEGTCIYRLVLYKERIEKLFICGSYAKH